MSENVSNTTKQRNSDKTINLVAGCVMIVLIVWVAAFVIWHQSTLHPPTADQTASTPIASASTRMKSQAAPATPDGLPAAQQSAAPANAAAKAHAQAHTMAAPDVAN